VCIRYRGNVSTEPLPSNDKRVLTEQMPTNDRGILTELLLCNDKEGYTDERARAHSNVIS
jgi:hypothetical protein